MKSKRPPLQEPSSFAWKPMAAAMGFVLVTLVAWKFFVNKPVVTQTPTQAVTEQIPNIIPAPVITATTVPSTPMEESSGTSNVTITSNPMSKAEIKEFVDGKILTLENKIKLSEASVDRQTNEDQKKELVERIDAAKRLLAQLQKVNADDPSSIEFIKQLDTRTATTVVDKARGTADQAIDAAKKTP